MKIIFTTSLVFLAFVSSAFDYPVEVTEQMFLEYKTLNDSDSNLVEFKDTDEMLRAKLEQLIEINKSRSKARVQPLKLDIRASRVANMICKEACENNYMGHWNLAGDKPYQRYARAGGVDHLVENAYAEWMLDMDYKDTSIPTIQTKMKVAHDSFMSERSPNDGHKQTVINGWHNNIGIGVYMTARQFTYYEEYVDKYLEIQQTVSSDGKRGIVKFKILDPEQFKLDQISCTYDRPVKPMSANKINKTESYNDFGDDHQYFFEEDLKQVDGWYTSEYDLSKSGSFYVQIILDPKDKSQLKKHGYIYASGVVFFRN